MQEKKKAPQEAATSKSANVEHIREQNTTKSPAGQGLFQAATALECLGIELGQTRQLVGLLVENLEHEGTDTMQPERVKVYSDCLWVLFDRLRTLEDVAQSEAAHTYGSKKRAAPVAGQDKTRKRLQSSKEHSTGRENKAEIKKEPPHNWDSPPPGIILPRTGAAVNDKRTACFERTEREPGGAHGIVGRCPALAVFVGLEVLHPPGERAVRPAWRHPRGLAAGNLLCPLGRGPWPGGTSRGIARSTRSKLREGGWVVAACAMLKTADTQAAAPAMPSEPKRAKRGLTAEALRTRRTVSGPAWASRARRTR